MESDIDRTVDLVLQLPDESRLVRLNQPSLSVDVSTYLLRSIEHKINVLVWQNTQDGQSKNPKNQPKPIIFDWEKSEQEKTFNKSGFLDISQINEGGIVEMFLSNEWVDTDRINISD